MTRGDRLLYMLSVLLAIVVGWCLCASTMEPEVVMQTEVQVQTVTHTVYRYPNSPPYQELDDPIDYEQALALLGGMRTSHVQILKWTFKDDPGFGIADKDLQEKFIRWYDQLIEYTQRQYENKNKD